MVIIPNLLITHQTLNPPLMLVHRVPHILGSAQVLSSSAWPCTALFALTPRVAHIYLVHSYPFWCSGVCRKCEVCRQWCGHPVCRTMRTSATPCMPWAVERFSSWGPQMTWPDVTATSSCVWSEEHPALVNSQVLRRCRLISWLRICRLVG